ncbi:MAG TPA: hypothetical protein VHC90_10360 [Bryobacteraceae bacterium]|nr:hypothetical protein [Bryobacteraceae bacterium]
MPKKVLALTLFAGLVVLDPHVIAAANAAPGPLIQSAGKAGVLWRDPVDIATRDLYYGPGGKANQPRGPYKFVEEDSNGTQPKFVIKDANDAKWTLKMGMEVRSETAASRLVWAVGYFANEDYFLPEIKVEGMPDHMKRGQKFIGHDGVIHNVRLKRHIEGEKNIGSWGWEDGPFAGTRELNGLRVMMAVINDWDLKKVNNKIFARKDGEPPIYMVSDLGATFGPPGVILPVSRSRGDLGKYAASTFIRRKTASWVDFETPRAPFVVMGFWPFTYVPRVKLDALLRHVPRTDAHWMGTLLARLSKQQIHDAFRAAGWQPDVSDAYANIVEDRIAQLRAL